MPTVPTIERLRATIWGGVDVHVAVFVDVSGQGQGLVEALPDSPLGRLSKSSRFQTVQFL
jgi:hypothetical protein